MILFIKILIAHFLADFAFLPDAWNKDIKINKHRSAKIYCHIVVHLGLMLVLTREINLIVPILIIGALHLIIELYRVEFQQTNNEVKIFIVYQIVHILVIIIILDLFTSFAENFKLSTINSNKLSLLILTLVLLTTVSSKLIKVLILKWSPQTEDSEQDSLKDAGKFIGMLERVFIFGFVITNNIQAVGFLLAAKSVFRFGDMREAKDRKLTEYILIGTLLSFGLAVLIGIMYLKLEKKVNNL